MANKRNYRGQHLVGRQHKKGVKPMGKADMDKKIRGIRRRCIEMEQERYRLHCIDNPEFEGPINKKHGYGIVQGLIRAQPSRNEQGFSHENLLDYWVGTEANIKARLDEIRAALASGEDNQAISDEGELSSDEGEVVSSVFVNSLRSQGGSVIDFSDDEEAVPLEKPSRFDFNFVINGDRVPFEIEENHKMDFFWGKLDGYDTTPVVFGPFRGGMEIFCFRETEDVMPVVIQGSPGFSDSGEGDIYDSQGGGGQISPVSDVSDGGEGETVECQGEGVQNSSNLNVSDEEEGDTFGSHEGVVKESKSLRAYAKKIREKNKEIRQKPAVVLSAPQKRNRLQIN